MLEAFRVPPEPRAGQGSKAGVIGLSRLSCVGVGRGRCSCQFIQRPSLNLDYLQCPISLQTPKDGTFKSVLPPRDLAKRVCLVIRFKNKSGRAPHGYRAPEQSYSREKG